MNKRLDHPEVPPYAVEFILYHEMLHVKHPIRAAACGLQSHQGLVLLFDPETGTPVCAVHAGEVTAIRTAGGA